MKNRIEYRVLAGTAVAAALSLAGCSASATSGAPSEPSTPNDATVQALLDWNGYEKLDESREVTPTDVARLRRFADAGDAHAQFLLGRMYRKGWYVDPSDATAVDWYRKSADQEYAPALSSLAYMRLKGLGVEKDVPEGVRLLQKAVDQDNARAMARLALLYQKGEELPRDLTKALQLNTKASDLGNAMATNNLAMAYDRGLGVGPSDERAYELYLQAAEMDSATAQVNVARMLLAGRGVAQDRPEAIAWLRRSAAQGYAKANVVLARVLYSENSGSELDREAYALAGAAASEGIAEGHFWVAIMQLTGRGVERDAVAAAEALRRSVELQFPPAMSVLGQLHFNGVGVAKDPQHAVQLFRAAARSGCRMGQYGLGFCFLHGHVVPQDPVMARQLLEAAAKQEHPQATGTLGYIFHEGIGVPKDLQMAERLYRRAIELGDGAARVSLALLGFEGDDAGKRNGFLMMKEAAESGERDAWSCLGYCYYVGLGTETNVSEAVRWLRRAADDGEGRAQYLLARIVLSADSDSDVVRGLDGERLLRNSARNGFAPAAELLARMDGPAYDPLEPIFTTPYDFTIQGPRDPLNPTQEEWEWMLQTHRENMRIDRIEQAREQGIPLWTVQ